MELREYGAQDAVGLAGLIRRGAVSAAEVEDAARRAIAAVEPELAATVGELYEEPLEASPVGPLAGVPFAMKEVSPHLKGQRTQLGSRLAGGGLVGSADTYLGRRIRAAGLRVLARTRSPEFAFNASTEPVAHGPTRNPWDRERSVGGSSGGSAALVAARALPLAHGTDSAGSIRIPASLCGLVGLKPTRGRIPVGPGQWEALHGLTHDFVLCRTLRDAAAALDAFQGPGPGEKYVIAGPIGPYAAEVGADPGHRRVRWTVDAWSGAPVAPECAAAVEAVAAVLADAGHEVDKGAPVIDADLLHRGLLVLFATGLAHRAGMLERLTGVAQSADSLEGCTLATLERGRRMSAAELLDGYGDCNTVGRAVGAFFETADVLVLPSVARLPWRLGELNQNDPALDADRWLRKIFTYVPFTAAFNVTGHPAISLPLAWSDGLPVGVQLVGRYGDEATLLRLAAQLEQALPWAARVPPIAAG